MPDLSIATFHMQIARKGLLLYWCIEKIGRGVIDLKKEFNLSDEKAMELLKQLDEREGRQ